MESIKQFKEKLKKEKEALETEIKKLGRPPEFGNDVDDSEETDESEEFERQLSLQAVLKKKLADVTSALRKIENGKYGFCEKCGCQISSAVLVAQPTSRLCQKCKKIQRKS